MRHPDARIVELATRQYAAFSVEQALSVGFTDRMMKRRVAAGRWESLDFGVFAIAGSPQTWEQRLIGACLAGPAAASHRAAAALSDLPGGEELVEVTALRHRRRHRDDVVWHESY